MVVRWKANNRPQYFPNADAEEETMQFSSAHDDHWHDRRLKPEMRTQYLFVFAQVHDEFRIPELLSVSELHGFDIKFPEDAEDRDTSRPFMILELESEEHARLLASRCILIK